MCRILTISDLHVGSFYGLMPQMWGQIRPNSVQRQLLKKWCEMCRNEKDIDYLIINGDAVNGLEKAEEGESLCMANVDDQIQAAASLVQMINCDKILVTYGSKYHTKANPNLDREFAKEIGANQHGYEINFQPKTLKDVIHLAHNISVSTSVWQYRTTPLAKELVAALLNESELYKYKTIVRSHAHYYCLVSFTSNFGLITPCWQTRTPYMIRKGLSLIPKLGYVILEKNEENQQWTVTPHTFNIPRPELTRV